MPTKAELEAELAELKRLLAERAPPADAAEAGQGTGRDEAAEAEGSVDWETELTDVLGRLDEFSHKKPLVLALGAFALGFLVGRIR